MEKLISRRWAPHAITGTFPQPLREGNRLAFDRIAQVPDAGRIFDAVSHCQGRERRIQFQTPGHQLVRLMVPLTAVPGSKYLFIYPPCEQKKYRGVGSVCQDVETADTHGLLHQG
jgi:hypothetical protein